MAVNSGELFGVVTYCLLNRVTFSGLTCLRACLLLQHDTSGFFVPVRAPVKCFLPLVPHISILNQRRTNECHDK